MVPDRVGARRSDDIPEEGWRVGVRRGIASSESCGQSEGNVAMATGACVHRRPHPTLGSGTYTILGRAAEAVAVAAVALAAAAAAAASSIIQAFCLSISQGSGTFALHASQHNPQATGARLWFAEFRPAYLPAPLLFVVTLSAGSRRYHHCYDILVLALTGGPPTSLLRMMRIGEGSYYYHRQRRVVVHCCASPTVSTEDEAAAASQTKRPAPSLRFKWGKPLELRLTHFQRVPRAPYPRSRYTLETVTNLKRMDRPPAPVPPPDSLGEPNEA